MARAMSVLGLLSFSCAARISRGTRAQLFRWRHFELVEKEGVDRVRVLLAPTRSALLVLVRVILPSLPIPLALPAPPAPRRPVARRRRSPRAPTQPPWPPRSSSSSCALCSCHSPPRRLRLRLHHLRASSSRKTTLVVVMMMMMMTTTTTMQAEAVRLGSSCRVYHQLSQGGRGASCVARRGSATEREKAGPVCPRHIVSQLEGGDEARAQSRGSCAHRRHATVSASSH